MKKEINPDDLLIEKTENGLNVLMKNDRGDFIRIASVSGLKHEPELDDHGQPRIRFEFHIEALQPINLTLVEYLSADSFHLFADKLRSLDSSDT